jgi:Ran GTPase-activating protein 1
VALAQALRELPGLRSLELNANAISEGGLEELKTMLEEQGQLQALGALDENDEEGESEGEEEDDDEDGDEEEDDQDGNKENEDAGPHWSAAAKDVDGIDALTAGVGRVQL